MNGKENGRGERYSYDEEGQLASAWYEAIDPANTYGNCQRQDHFGYDELGNRRDWNHIATRSWQYFPRKDNGLNQYRAWSPYSVINYDDDIGNGWGAPGAANGVLMQDGHITAGFNALNQPMYIWSGTSGWMHFGYDPLGRCVKRWNDGGAATYLFYDGWNLIQEGPQASNPSRLYVHGGRVDELVAQITPANNAISYFHYDASGNCILQTDDSGAVMEQYYYDAFGYPYFHDRWGNNLGSSPSGNRFLFTGREWLSDLKLYDYRNRLYQPELGRFLQPDPKHFAAGDYNLYRYCHNDPVNKSDPLGLLEFEIQGDTEFKAQITAHLAAIDSKPAGHAYLNELRASPFQMIIVPGAANTTQALNGPDSMNGKGAGSLFRINPNLTESAKDSTGNIKRPEFIGTAHETVGHGIDNARGQRLPKALDNRIDKIPRSEKAAVGRENEIRKEHSIPERVEFYKRP